MRVSVKRSVTLLFLIYLVMLVAASAAVNAQTSTRVSTALLDVGILRPGSSVERDVILTNPADNSTVTYSVTFTNVTNSSGTLTATPSRGSIGPKSNVTIAVRLDVPSDAKEGSFSSNMVVNESKVPNVGGSSTALPALVGHVSYTVQGSAPSLITLSDVDVPLVAGVLGVFALLAVVAVYVILRKT